MFSDKRFHLFIHRKFFASSKPKYLYTIYLTICGAREAKNIYTTNKIITQKVTRMSFIPILLAWRYNFLGKIIRFLLLPFSKWNIYTEMYILLLGIYILRVYDSPGQKHIC